MEYKIQDHGNGGEDAEINHPWIDNVGHQVGQDEVLASYCEREMPYFAKSMTNALDWRHLKWYLQDCIDQSQSEGG
jgi:hypothetical protein